MINGSHIDILVTMFRILFFMLPNTRKLVLLTHSMCASQVEYLCEHGADVNRGLRSSSLHYAACFGRPQIVRV